MCTTISKGNAYLCFVLFLFLARRQSRKPVEKLKMRKWVYRGPMLTLRQEQEQEQEQKLKQEEKVAKEAGKHCKMSAQANGARAPRQQTNKQHSKHECFVWYAVRRERDGARGRKRERARTEGKTTGARWVEKGRHAAGSRVYKLFSVSSKKKKKTTYPPFALRFAPWFCCQKFPSSNSNSVGEFHKKLYPAAVFLYALIFTQLLFELFRLACFNLCMNFSHY